MAAPLAALLFFAGAYYVFRLAPRISQRAAMAQGRRMGVAYAFNATKPYSRYETCFEPVMSEREAFLLLGFSEDVANGNCTPPTDKQIKEQYYKLVKRLHSDVDGSVYITTKLNEARDLLLKR